MAQLPSDPKWRTKATQRAEMHLRNVHYVLYEKTKVETVHSNDKTTTIKRDEGNEGSMPRCGSSPCA